MKQTKLYLSIICVLLAYNSKLYAQTSKKDMVLMPTKSLVYIDRYYNEPQPKDTAKKEIERIAGGFHCTCDSFLSVYNDNIKDGYMADGERISLCWCTFVFPIDGCPNISDILNVEAANIKMMETPIYIKDGMRVYYNPLSDYSKNISPY